MSDPFVPLTAEEIESLQPAVVKLLREAGRKYPCHDESEFLNQVDDLFTMALASLSLPSPCGHPSQYAYSEDGGKVIICLLCERAKPRTEGGKLPDEAVELLREASRLLFNVPWAVFGGRVASDHSNNIDVYLAHQQTTVSPLAQQSEPK